MRKYRFIWIASLMAVALLVATCAPKPAPTPVPKPPAPVAPVPTPIAPALTPVPGPSAPVAPVPAPITPAPATPALTPAVKLPAILSLATAGVGSSSYIAGSAFSEVIGKYLGIKVSVEPAGGSNRWIPLMKTKEVDIGFGCGFTDVKDAYYSVEFWKDKGPQPVLHLATGQFTPQPGLVTDPKITSWADLKGKKVFGQLTGARHHTTVNEITFREAGLKPGDVEVLSYADVNEAAKGVLEGKAIGILNQSATAIPIVELDRTKPLYAIPVPKEMADKVREQLPELGYIIWKKGDGISKADTPILSVACGFHARADLDTEVVYTLLKTFYAHYNEYKDKHPLLKDYTPERGVSLIFVPMHPGAIKYYKEMGLWKAEQEALQQKALAKPRGG